MLNRKVFRSLESLLKAGSVNVSAPAFFLLCLLLLFTLLKMFPVYVSHLTTNLRVIILNNLCDFLMDLRIYAGVYVGLVVNLVC